MSNELYDDGVDCGLDGFDDDVPRDVYVHKDDDDGEKGVPNL